MSYDPKDNGHLVFTTMWNTRVDEAFRVEGFRDDDEARDYVEWFESHNYGYSPKAVMRSDGYGSVYVIAILSNNC